MSERKVLNMKEYVEDGKLCLENFKLENCKIAELQCKEIYFEKCIFSNVIFESHFDDVSISIEECEFRHCEFHGSLGQSYLVLKDNLFKESQFENIRMEFDSEVSYMAGNGFFNCSFKNVKLESDIEYLNQYISGGKIEDVLFRSSNMTSNQFLNMRFKDVELSAYFIDNKMHSVLFENVTLTGVMKECPGENNLNVFFKCDTSGFTFIDQYARY